MPTVLPKQVRLSDVKCPNCGNTVSITLRSWTQSAKRDWEMEVHGISAKCTLCNTLWNLTEDFHK